MSDEQEQDEYMDKFFDDGDREESKVAAERSNGDESANQVLRRVLLDEIIDEYASLMATVRGSSDDPKTDARLNVAMELLNQAAGSNVELFGVLEALKEDAPQSDKKRRVTKKLQQMMGSDMR